MIARFSEKTTVSGVAGLAYLCGARFGTSMGGAVGFRLELIRYNTTYSERPTVLYCPFIALLLPKKRMHH